MTDRLHRVVVRIEGGCRWLGHQGRVGWREVMRTPSRWFAAFVLCLTLAGLWRWLVPVVAKLRISPTGTPPAMWWISQITTPTWEWTVVEWLGNVAFGCLGLFLLSSWWVERSTPHEKSPPRD